MLEFKNADINIGRNEILRDISVCFEKGRITSVIGPNGCGKTTLLQSLIGLSSVKKGSILLDGEDYFSYKPRERAKRLSFMSQFRENTPNITVAGLVEHGRFPHMGFARKMNADDRSAIERAIRLTGLYDERDIPVCELSGGMQQRAYLAMQLAQECPYMVFEEPMNHLDFPAQREMYGLIKKLNREGITIIIVLHDLNHALQISDNIVIMKNRAIVYTGTAKECLKTGIIEQVFDCRIHSFESGNEMQYLIG